MAINEIIIPKTGLNMDDCSLLGWHVAEGAYVNEGDVIFEMEIEKAVMDIEADYAGWLHQSVEPSEDKPLPIGTVIGLIAETQDEYNSILSK
ncbi:MAG: hypothetical protein CL398_05790 [Acidiferrobacteraceae bacterium]|nr:hypothetical protein [Acidiferrobacteraceae bacterium]|tara:strand:- start:583 stop:858 length:276 start_codon:yes stop_codon:yes gene_type:complete